MDAAAREAMLDQISAELGHELKAMDLQFHRERFARWARDARGKGNVENARYHQSFAADYHRELIEMGVGA